MQAVPIQPRAIAHTAVRNGTGTKKPARIATSGIHHASKLVGLLPSQSREVSAVGLLMTNYPQRAAPDRPARWA